MTSLLDAASLAIPRRLQPTALQLASGQMVALIGPNGSGKTSLLRALAGIDPAGGSVLVEGVPLAAAVPRSRAALAAFLPASRDLAWPIAARDIIGLGLASPDPARVEALIALLDLASFADRPANALSTGERTRVLLARALASRPRVLLLDEPLSNLDPYWVLRVIDILRAEADDGRAVIASLHDLGQADRFDRVLLMDHGRIVADRPPAAMVLDSLLGKTFGVSVRQSDWRVSLRAGPRSSP